MTEPAPLASKAEVTAALATGEWVAKMDPIRQRPYYVNPHTRQATWNLAKTLATLHQEASPPASPEPAAKAPRRDGEETDSRAERARRGSHGSCSDVDHTTAAVRTDSPATVHSESGQTPPPSVVSTAAPATEGTDTGVAETERERRENGEGRAGAAEMARISSSSLSDAPTPPPSASHRESTGAASSTFANNHNNASRGSSSGTFTGADMAGAGSPTTYNGSASVNTLRLLPRQSSTPLSPFAFPSTAATMSMEGGGTLSRGSVVEMALGLERSANARSDLTTLANVSVSTMSDTQLPTNTTDGFPSTFLLSAMSSAFSRAGGHLPARVHRPNRHSAAGRHPLVGGSNRLDHSDDDGSDSDSGARATRDSQRGRDHRLTSSGHKDQTTGAEMERGDSEADSEELEEQTFARELQDLEEARTQLESEVAVLKAPVEAETARLQAAERSLEAAQKALAEAVEAAVKRRTEKQSQLDTLREKNKWALQERERHKATFEGYEQRRRHVESRRATVLGDLASLEQQIAQLHGAAVPAEGRAWPPQQAMVATATSELAARREGLTQLRVTLRQRKDELAEWERALAELTHAEKAASAVAAAAAVEKEGGEEVGSGAAPLLSLPERTEAHSTASGHRDSPRRDQDGTTAPATGPSGSVERIRREYATQRARLAALRTAREEVQAILCARRVQATLTRAVADATFTARETQALCREVRDTVGELREALRREEAALQRIQAHHGTSMAYLQGMQDYL